MGNKIVLGVILFLLLPPLFIFSMGSKENELNGNKLYKDGDFEGASLAYSEGLTKKADYDLYYNRGVSFYKLGQFDKAFSDFEDAATYADSKRDQIQAVYNAGNSNFMMAETVKPENPGQALEFYGQAVKHFERVLELDNANKDASYNLELSRLRQDELNQQKSENSQNKDQQNGDQQSESQKNEENKEGNDQNGDQQKSNSQDTNQNNTAENEQGQTAEESPGKDQENTDSLEPSYLSEEISPKDILNEEARRQEAAQILIKEGSGQTVDKDW